METVKPSRLRWWATRLGVAFAAMVLLAVGAWGWLAWDSSRRLAAVIDAAHARGEPILPGDFKPVALPDAENAAPLLRAAMAALSLTDPQREATDSVTRLPKGLTASQVDAAVASIAIDHPEVLPLIAEARARGAVEWNVPLASPAMMTNFSYLNGVRALANYRGAVAMRQHRAGEDGAFIEGVGDVLFIARAGGESRFLVPHLVGVGCEALGDTMVLRAAPDLSIGGSGGGASPGAVRGLIARLLDEGGRSAEFADVLRHERVMALDEIASAGGGGGRSSSIYVRYNSVHAAEQIGMLIAAAGAANWPAAKGAIVMPPKPTPLRPFEMLSDLIVPSLSKAVKAEYRISANRRLAAAALAIRLYQTDHGGKRPAALADLVPAYLPAVPIDPFAPGGLPLRYSESPTARLWSVGENGRDDGGSLAPAKSEGGRVRDEWAAPDAVFPLDAARR